MFQMLKTKRQVAHVPVNPKFSPELKYKFVKSLQQYFLNFVESIMDIRLINVQFLSYCVS